MSEVMTRPAAKAQTGLAAPAPAKHSFKPLRECTSLGEAFETLEFRERIEASVPQHVQPGRMLRTFVTAAQRTPLLAKASLRSFIGACLSLSQVGLEPNTPLGHAYLIPFKRTVKNPATGKWDLEIVEINVIFGYPGLLDLSYRTGLVQSVHADVVWPGDDFSAEYGTDAHLRHRPKGVPRAAGVQPTSAYMHAVLKDGQAFEVMPYADVLAIRDKSQAYRSAIASRATAIERGWKIPSSYTEAPWIAHETAMARKTAFRAGSKWLPRSIELASAIAIDEAQDRRRSMDFGSVMDANTIDGSPDYLSAAVDAATGEEEGEPERTEPTRTQVQVNKPPAQPQAPDVDRWGDPVTTRTAAPTTTKTTPPAESRRPTTPPFEGVIIDHTGNILREEPYTSTTECTDALLIYYRGLSAEEASAFLEHNADLIEELRTAHQIGLAELDAPPEAATPTVLVGVSVPPGRSGKPSWPDYLKAIREAVANTPVATLSTWIEMNRDTLSACPMAQRLLAVKAITTRCNEVNQTPPAWLANILKPAPAPAQREVAQQQQPQEPDDGWPGPDTATGQVTPPQTTADDRDERWADSQIKEVETFRAIVPAQEALARFEQLAEAAAIKTVMSRLRREKPATFQRVSDAFNNVLDAINARIPEAPPEDDGPPADQGGY